MEAGTARSKQSGYAPRKTRSSQRTRSTAFFGSSDNLVSNTEPTFPTVDMLHPSELIAAGKPHAVTSCFVFELYSRHHQRSKVFVEAADRQLPSKPVVQQCCAMESLGAVQTQAQHLLSRSCIYEMRATQLINLRLRSSVLFRYQFLQSRVSSFYFLAL